MKFLVDNQLPVALARFLAARGLECRHVLEIDLAQASDSEIWRYAENNKFVLVSKDVDFFHLAAKPDSRGHLIWIRLGNCRTPQLLAAIEQVWPRIQASLEGGERVVEVR